jgi:arginase family enzyme
MNFTHVYEQEEILGHREIEWIDCTQIYGTSCYCDEKAVELLTKKISACDPEGIHLIDSGNYHYVSKLWTDKISYPFSLIVFDHHPDMQPALFDNLLSCGCWVKEVLDTNPCLHKVCIVGASDKLIRNTTNTYGDKVVFYSEQALNHEQAWRRFSRMHFNEPVYISVDKDVLDSRSAATNWDQGNLTLSELERLLVIILRQQKVAGVDICGECAASAEFLKLSRDNAINLRTNRELIRLIGRYTSLAG